MEPRRAPIDRVIDVAVATPVCALTAARQLVPLVGRVGALGTATAVRRLSEAVHELRGGAVPLDDVPTAEVATTEGASVPPGDLVTADPAGDHSVPAAADVADLPIEGYDDLAARQVVSRLSSLGPDDLATVEAYERAHRGRSTVLGKIAQLTA